MTAHFDHEDFIETQTEDGKHESRTTVRTTLCCIAPGYPPSFDPHTGGDPGADPEFDVICIKVQPSDREGKYAPLWHTFDYNVASLVYGDELAEALVLRAEEAAIDSGDF